jgi:paraquat-inducible protein A
LYVPANQLPIMTVTQVGRPQADTIFTGIVHFAHTGAWPLALVVFIASVLVPVLKIAILSVLLLTERARSTWRPRLRARLYRLTEVVGRWSMLDIYVLALMVAMVERGGLASIAPGPGAMAFALMAVTAILAVRSFDPRLLWDALEPRHG